MTYVGGLRSRLIKDSLYNMVRAALNDLNWLDTGRQHAQVHFNADAVENEREVPINTLTLSDENFFSIEEELGSQLAEHQWTFYLDFYSESTALGIHMAQDLKCILEGRMSQVNRTDSKFDVYDYTLATPVTIFKCDIEDVAIDRARGFSHPWQRYWYVVSCTVIDHYGRDDDQG